MTRYLLTTKRLFVIAFVLFGASLFWACEETFDFGEEQLPGSDKMDIRTDSMFLSTRIISGSADSTGKMKYAVWGSYIDPVFGSTRAEFVTQFGIKDVFTKVPMNSFPDSAVLYFYTKHDTKTDANNYYGNSSIFQNMRIFELNANVDYRNKYPINTSIHSITNYNNFLGEKAVVRSLNDSIISIRLSQNLTQKLFAFQSLASVPVKPTEFFIENYLKGICVLTDARPQNASLFYIDLTSSYTALKLYFHTVATSGAITNNSVSYVVNQFCSRFNGVKHLYENSDIHKYIDQDIQAPYTGVQAFGGVRTLVKMPAITEMIKDTVGKVVLGAELVFYSDSSNFSNALDVPDSLVICARDAAGKEYFLKDFRPSYYDNISNPNHIYNGVGYLGTKEKQFRFNISYFVQQMLRGNIKNLDLVVYNFINKNSSYPKPQRAVLNLKNNGKVKLILTYGQRK